MALDPNNTPGIISGTDPNWSPDNWLTPQQIAAKYAYAQMLQKAGQTTPTGSSGPFTAVSPWGVAGQIANSAAGALVANQAGAADKQRQLALGNATTPEPYGAQSANPASAPIAVAPSAAPSAGPALANAPSDAWAKATSAQESGGNYQALGPVINKGSLKGDRAYGKYQIMGTNIPSWTQQVLGVQMTPSQFLSNPDAQDKVYKAKMGEYIQKYGLEGAARAWIGGPGAVNHPERTDQLGTSAGAYGQQFLRNLGAQPAAAQPPSLAGQKTSSAVTSDVPLTGPTVAPSVSQAYQGAPPPQAPTAAPQAPVRVAGGPAPSAAIPRPAEYPVQPTQPQQTIPPFLVPPRPQISRQQMINAQALAPDSPATQQLRDLYMNQYQPQGFKVPYGTVSVGPQGQQFFVGDIIDYPIEGPGGIKIPGRAQYQQDGSLKILTPSTGGSPAASPQPQPQSQPRPPVPGTPPVPGGTPGPQGANQTAFPKTASLGPAPGTATDAPAPGMLGAQPPATPPPVIPTASPPPTPPGAKMAQTVIPQYASDAINQMGTLAAQQELKKEAATKGAQDAAQFTHDTLQKGRLAEDEGQKLNLLTNITNSPNYYSGFGSPLVLLKNKMVAALGGDPKSAADMELADKFMNDLNLDSLKSRLGGLGQIRVFEGNMVERAFLNRDNSVAANQALVEYAKAVNQRLIDAADMTKKALVANGGIPDPLIETRVYDYFKDKPIFTDDQAKKWNSMITADLDKKGGQQGNQQSGAPPLPPGFKLLPQPPKTPPPVNIPM